MALLGGTHDVTDLFRAVTAILGSPIVWIVVMGFCVRETRASAALLRGAIIGAALFVVQTVLFVPKDLWVPFDLALAMVIQTIVASGMGLAVLYLKRGALLAWEKVRSGA